VTPELRAPAMRGRHRPARVRAARPTPRPRALAGGSANGRGSTGTAKEIDLSTADAKSLDRAPYISLVTYRRDGRAVATPVWHAEREGRLYVFTEAASGKVKRLRREPKVRLARCDVRGRLRGDWWAGRARVVEDAKTERAAYAALRAKYGWQMWLVDLGSRLTGRIDGRAVLEIDVDGPAEETR